MMVKLKILTQLELARGQAVAAVVSEDERRSFREHYRDAAERVKQSIRRKNTLIEEARRRG